MSEQDSQDDSQVKSEDRAEYKVGKTKAEPEQQKAPGKGSSGVAWLALLLVVVLALGAAWLAREGQHREEVLAQRLAALESVAGNERASLDAASDRWQQQLRSGLAQLEKTLDELLATVLDYADGHHFDDDVCLLSMERCAPV